MFWIIVLMVLVSLACILATLLRDHGTKPIERLSHKHDGDFFDTDPCAMRRQEWFDVQAKDRRNGRGYPTHFDGGNR